MTLRMDRSHLPADPRRQHDGLHLPARRAARVPRARRAVRKHVAAAGRDPDRADDVCCARSWACYVSHGDNNIFTQIGLIVLVGLACKNAILIVEFAKDREAHGESTWQAVLDACRLRLRPILMTSLAFVMGVVPLVTSTGAGSEMRRAMGVAVFSGNARRDVLRAAADAGVLSRDPSRGAQAPRGGHRRRHARAVGRTARSALISPLPPAGAGARQRG